MFKDIDVSAIVFYVKDMNRTTVFYRDVLGFSVRSVESQDGSFVIAQAGSTLLLFFENEETPGKTPIVVFGLDGGIEDIIDTLASKNVEIVLPVSESPDGGLTADFLDPDGHTLSVHQPAGAPRRKNHN